MPDKTVIIAGAGFSAPARIPIQSQIMDDMIALPPSILDSPSEDLDIDTKTFFDAFVQVGLYLLDNYCTLSKDVVATEFMGVTTQDLRSHYERAQKFSYQQELFSVLVKQAQLLCAQSPNVSHQELMEFLATYMPNTDNHFRNLYDLKMQVKLRLSRSQCKICLEDLFTALDKATGQRIHSRYYTYEEEDRIKHAILRLFVYYFGKRLRQHQYCTPDYLAFLRYVQQNQKQIAFLTTNWDTLPEEYFKRNGVAYNLGLNSTYFRFEPYKRLPAIKGIPLIKLHGSINWFRCLRCGTITIMEKPSFGDFLFKEESVEQCKECGATSKNNIPILQPDIMTPTMVKLFDNQLYKNLWRAGALELRKANHIIFVGYSMPTADFELKYMLQENIPVDARIDVVLHCNDDPARVSGDCQNLKDLLPERRYRDAFAKNEVCFFYNGFCDYFTEATNKL